MIRAGAERRPNSSAERRSTPGPNRKPSHGASNRRDSTATGSSSPGRRPRIVPWSSGTTTHRPSSPNMWRSRAALPAWRAEGTEGISLTAGLSHSALNGLPNHRQTVPNGSPDKRTSQEAARSGIPPGPRRLGPADHECQHCSIQCRARSPHRPHQLSRERNRPLRARATVANRAPVRATRSAGASSISRPR